MKVKARVPLTATNDLGEIVDWMSQSQTFVQNVVFAERKVAENQVKIIDAMERRLRKVFGVKHCEINLELPRQAEITEMEPVITPALRPDENVELGKIKKKWKEYDEDFSPLEHRSEPVPDLYRDKHDLKFVDKRTKAALLTPMGTDKLRDLGLYNDVRQIQSEVPKFKSKHRPRRGFHSGTRRRDRGRNTQMTETDEGHISESGRRQRNDFDDEY